MREVSMIPFLPKGFGILENKAKECGEMWQSKPHFTAKQKNIVFNNFIVILFGNTKY